MPVNIMSFSFSVMQSVFFESAAERRAGERRRVRRIRAVENVLRADIFEQCAKLFLKAEARRVEIDMAHIALEI